MWRVPAAALVFLFAIAPVAADGQTAVNRLTMTAADAFEHGMGAHGVRLAADGKGVVLYDRTLIEDDGPGIGSDAKWLEKDRSPTEDISGEVRLKKVLIVDRPEALAAQMYVPRGVAVEVNGSLVTGPGDSEHPEMPVALLKKGPNEVVLHCPEGAKATIKVATREDILRNAPERADRPRRSFRSADGGKTWEAIDGEYLVRVQLVQYARNGSFVSPSIDLGDTGSGGGLLLTPISVKSVALKPDADTPEGTSVRLAVRTGPCPVYDAALWTDWRAQEAPVPQGHRYLQWTAALESPDPLKTPVLKAVTVAAEISREPLPAWAGNVKVLSAHNGELRWTSIPYAYEDFKHPRLAALREKYKLDEVVAGAATEFEKLVKLRDWVSRQWRYKPPEKHYPAWDADEILTLKYGFCVQYAIVYMQCCLSLGYNARFVFGYHPGIMGGHEVCEVWSNQYDKWVLMDPNVNHHFVDPKTNEPLSMMEVHDRMVREYYGDKQIARSNHPPAPKGSDRIATRKGLEIEPPDPADDSDTNPKKWPRWAKWAVIRMMPRNNFHAQTYPLPKTQGATWDWTEYWIWEDAQTPRSHNCEYRHITGRRADWEWTLNRVRFDATCGEKPGTLAIQMGTFTPGLETFLVNVDGGGWKESGRTLAWELHSGANRLEMRVRNKAGVEGPISFIEASYGE